MVPAQLDNLFQIAAHASARPVDAAERLEIALQAADFATWDLDLQNDRYFARSLKHDQIFGYECLQSEWSRAIAEQHVIDTDRPAFKTAFENAIATGVLRVQVRVRWPDRSVHWIAIDGRTYYGEQGEAVRMAGVMREITVDKAAEQSSAQANALLDAIFEAAPVGLGAWDENFRFLRVNERLAEINGLPPEGHIGKRPDEILPDITSIEENVYARWRQVLATGEPWLDAEVTGATPAQPGVQRSWSENFFPIRSAGRIIGIGAVVEETTEKKRHEAQMNLLLQEVNHRAKNLLAVVQAVVHQSARTPQELAFCCRLSKRLSGLAACQDLLVRNGWGGVCLKELAAAQLAHFKDMQGTRLRIEGPSVHLTSASAQTIGMALHELGTNAGKYGALSVSTGQVSLTWQLDEENGAGRSLVIEWLESGGPQVTSPCQYGFGHKVTTQMVEYALDAEVALRYEPEGLRWICKAPAASVLDVHGTSQ